MTNAIRLAISPTDSDAPNLARRSGAIAAMGLVEANDGADAVRRRRLTFRAWHRGMREVDLLLGRFADARVPAMDEENLAAFEALLDLPDPQILSWVTGEAEVPAEHDSRFVRQLIAFHR